MSVKKNIFYILAILCLLPLASGSFAQSLSGDLSGSYGPGTLTLDGNCYVQGGQILRFEPGTRIEATGYYVIEVRGILDARGTQDQKIVFTTAESNSEGWGGLRFIQTDFSSIITYAVFENASNVNLNQGFGGAIYLNRSDISIDQTEFINNEAAFGGAVYTYNAEASFSNCTFTRNHATNIGGAVYASTVNPMIDHCLFDRNTADNNGGALYFTLANSQIYNCTFFGNRAEAGGALYIRSGYQILNSSIIAHSQGGGVVTDNMSSGCQIYYSLFHNNDGGDAYSNGIHAAFGIVLFTNANGDSSDYLGNLFLNPEFVNSDESNFYLMPQSVCIDAGDPDELMTDPDGTTCDMGAFYRDLAPVENGNSAVSEITGFELLNVWPNPFNSHLNISFKSMQPGIVKIKVYDILGKEVYSDNLDYSSGILNTSWNADNFSSGTYLLKVTHSTNSRVLKMYLIK